MHYPATSLQQYRSANKLHLGKNILNVAAMQDSDFPESAPISVHRVNDKLCPKKEGNPTNHQDSLVVVHHYTGTSKQFHFRDDPRHKLGGRNSFKRSTRGTDTPDDSMRSWLKGFMEDVGINETLRLLKGVGQPGYEDETSNMYSE
jgi:hypothetical protein